jgi:protein ImuB
MLVAMWPEWPVVAAGYPPDVPAAVVVANHIQAVTAAARHEGVTPGLRRREAQRRCPELEVVAGDPGRDARAWEPVVAAVETMTPLVEVMAPGCLGLTTRGPSRYFGGDAALAVRVQAVAEAAAAQAGCRVGVADGHFTAFLAAAAAGRAGTGWGLEAGTASGPGMGGSEGPGRGGPGRGGPGPVIVAPGGSRAWLAPQPVSALGPDYADLADLLVRLGIRTLGELAALPAPAVLGRFGPVGQAAHRLARGRDDHPFRGRQPPPELACQAEFDPPEMRAEAAAFVAKALAD